MSKLLCFSGIHADSGDYLIPPLSVAEVANLASGGSVPDGANIEDFRIWIDTVKRGRPFRRIEEDLSDLNQAGWALVFAKDQSEAEVDAIQDALSPLIEHRGNQSGRLILICRGEKGYHQGDLREEFLIRNGAPPNGAADPKKLPYYVLIVGDPEIIPYEFQYQLDAQYAVGRIWFDTLAEYRRYAQSVVEAEKAPPPSKRRAVFFAPRHGGDPATAVSADQLTDPLVHWAKAFGPSWDVEGFVGEQATRERLNSLLGTDVPSLLFTAGHGVSYASGDPRQRDGQGALICQDWPGPHHPVEPQQIFAASDLRGDAQVHGMVAFHFACDSAGTSSRVEFIPGSVVDAAEKSFIAKLPQRLLAHPNGGALAVIGHVSGAWFHSIDWPGGGQHIEVFEDAVKSIMSGQRIGAAMEPFGLRYMDQSVVLSDILEDFHWGPIHKEEDLVRFWTAKHDTRNFVVIGDPAVRLCV